MTKFLFIFLVVLSNYGFAQEVSKPYFLSVYSFELSPDNTLDASVLRPLEELQEGDQLDLRSFMFIIKEDGEEIPTPLEFQNLMKDAVVTQIGFRQYFRTKHFRIGFQSNPHMVPIKLVENQ